jgi:hypothetical protein
MGQSPLFSRFLPWIWTRCEEAWSLLWTTATQTIIVALLVCRVYYWYDLHWSAVHWLLYHWFGFDWGSIYPGPYSLDTITKSAVTEIAEDPSIFAYGLYVTFYVSWNTIRFIYYIMYDIQSYMSKMWYNRKVSANRLKAAAKLISTPKPKPKSLQWHNPLFLIATLCYGIITCLTDWYISVFFDLTGPLAIGFLWRCKRNMIRDKYPLCLHGNSQSINLQSEEYIFWLRSGYKLWWWVFSSRFIITFTRHIWLHWTPGSTSFQSTLHVTTCFDVIWCLILYRIHVVYMRKSCCWVRDLFQWTCPILWTDVYGNSGVHFPFQHSHSAEYNCSKELSRKHWWNLYHDKSRTTNNWLCYMIVSRIILTGALMCY